MKASFMGVAMGSTRPRPRAAAAVSLAAVAALAWGETSTAATEVNADLIQTGRLAICSSFPRVRFAKMDADGEPFGVDIDVGLDDDCRAAGHPTVDLREYPRQEEAEDALARGEVDAYSGNDFVTVDRPREFALSPALPPIRNGIGLRKGASSLHGAIRDALDAMIADGTYLAILDRYDVSHAVISAPG